MINPPVDDWKRVKPVQMLKYNYTGYLQQYVLLQ